MTDWTFALDAGDFERASGEIDWKDAYVGECSLVSPSRLLPNGLVQFPNATPDLRMVVVVPQAQCAIEFHVHLADEVHVRQCEQVRPGVIVGRTDVELSLADAGLVRGRALRWRVLEGADAWAAGRLGRAYPPDDEFDDDRFWRPR